MPKSPSHKQWSQLTLACLLSLLASLALFNWAVDPLWCFGHTRWLTTLQKPFNERHQKTNYLTFVNKGEYDALILGNSRTSLISQHELGGMHAYNYALSAMTPDEFREYLDYFKKTNGRPKTILMGIDFDYTNANMPLPAGRPEFYIKSAQSPLYRYRMLLTYDTFDYSRQNLTIGRYLERSKHGCGGILYDNHNLARLLKPQDQAYRQQYIDRELAGLSTSFGTGYRYRDNLADSLRQIVRDNQGSRFIAFTTPVSKLFFCSFVKAGRLPEYRRWLREMVSVYGEVWNFQYLNSVTNDYADNYSDSHHFYPEIGTLVAHRITGVPDDKIPADFGTLVTRDNLEQHLAKVSADAEACSELAFPAPPAKPQ